MSKETGMIEIKADALDGAFEVAALRDEMAALKGQMDAQAIAAGRPALDGAKQAGAERTAFVERYLRQGSETGVELKSFDATTTGNGGFAVPREIDAQIDATLKAISPIRRVANVVQVGSAGYRKLVTTGGVASGWAGEGDARPETGTPTFREIVPPSGDLYANPAASQAMLDDAAFDVEAWLANEIATEFAKAEGAAFVSRSGRRVSLDFARDERKGVRHARI